MSFSLSCHLPGIVSFAHGLIRGALRPGDVAVDATAGNGHDTVLLAELVGAKGRVFAFDVQAAALAATRQRLQQQGLAERVQLLQASHADMARYLPKGVQAIMFNLGWLPGGDKTVTTDAVTTIAALQAALELLQPHGLLVMVVYQGHPGARQERDAVEQWLAQQEGTSCKCIRYQMVQATRVPAPYVLALERIR